MKMRKAVVPILVFMATLIFTVSPGFAFLGDDKFEQEKEKEKGAIKLAREVLSGGYGLVSTEELKQMIDNKEDFLLIDTMPFEDSYKKNHIPGAEQFLFPIPEMASWDTTLTDNRSVDDFLSLLGDDRQRKIVFYCGFVKCTRSHNGALWAVKQGYTNVYRHPGGIFAWKGAGYEAEKVD